MPAATEGGVLKPEVEVRRAADRFHTSIDWLDSHHSFNFNRFFDPINTNHGPLLVSNDDVVKGGTGFSTHPHRDMEIVTWVLNGELHHKDSAGNSGVIYPGLAQRMSAGTGIWHSEMNASPGQDVHFVQMWVPPDTESINPGYEQLDINPQLAGGGLVPIASGRGHDAAISIRQKDAVLWAGQLKPGETEKIPDAPYVHLYVARGGGELEGAGRLASGDAVRLTAAGSPAFTADPETGAELLIWETGPFQGQ
jgi:redox-sensitive bicupin YhaK (pirin superfamily)